MTLEMVWQAATDHAPALLARSALTDAAGYESEAHRRRRWPEVTVTLQGDAGKRARPGDERTTGPGGARGDLTTLVTWPLYESQRRALGEHLQGLERQAAYVEEAQRADVRLQSSWAFIEAVASIVAVEHLEVTRTQTAVLVTLIRTRVEEGVESSYSALVMEERQQQIESELLAARMSRDLAILNLSSITGRCTIPASPENTSLEQGVPLQQKTVNGRASIADDHPRIAAIEEQALATRAQGEVLGRVGLFDVSALGSAGVYASRAFEDTLEPEYYAGLRASWRPDWSGVRRSQRQAAMSRANALGHDVDSLRLKLTRELDALDAERKHLYGLLQTLEARIELSRERLRIARLRFEEGAAPLAEVIDAHRMVSQVEAEHIDLRAAHQLLLLRLAATGHRWDDLARNLRTNWESNR